MNIETDTAFGGPATAEEQARAAFILNDSGEDVISLAAGPDEALALIEALSRMSAAATMAVTDGRSFSLSLALSAVEDAIADLDGIDPALLHSSLSAVGAASEMVFRAAYYRTALDEDEFDGMVAHLDAAGERLRRIAKSLHGLAQMVTEQQELDRKRALYRPRAA